MKMASLVQEAPGLYGSVRIEEEIIQWIWNEKLLLLDDLRTECGKKLILQKSGHWNRAEEGGFPGVQPVYRWNGATGRC